MLLILYSQPFRSLFCKVQDLDTQHFQLACPLSQCGDLMWYCNVGEVRIDDLYNLVIVVADALKLEIKVVKSGDELRLRRVASDNDGLLVEDSFNNKTTPVMLQSGFAEQLAKADVLLFIKPERVFITRRSGLLIGLVCRFSVHIHIWLKKGSRLGRTPSLAERAPLYAEKLFGIQRYSSLLSGDNKNPRRRISDQSFENPPLRLPEPGRFPVQYYNRFGAKKIHRCGLERSGADIGTKVFHPVVSCSMKGRFSYSVHYPDINRMKRKTVF